MPNCSMSIFKTNGKRHTAESYAMMTADRLVHYDPSISDSETIASARALENRIMAVILPHHAVVQDGEATALKAGGGMDRLGTRYNPAEHVDLDAVTAAVIACANGTPWEPIWADPQVQTNIRIDLGDMFATNMHVERGWHADENIHDPRAKAFKAALGAQPDETGTGNAPVAEGENTGVIAADPATI